MVVCNIKVGGSNCIGYVNTIIGDYYTNERLEAQYQTVIAGPNAKRHCYSW